MTSLDILSGHLELSVDEIGAVLDTLNDISFRLECNMDQMMDDYLEVELSHSQLEMIRVTPALVHFQTPLSVLVWRIGGCSEKGMKHILDNCAAVGYQFGSIQRWYEDWMDSALDETDTTEQEIRDALIHRA